MDIDIVYILGTGSKWHNREIRYSLRSIAKNLNFKGRVFIIGEFPRWLDSTKVTNIPMRDPSINKLYNAIHKITAACKTEQISERFILMNDDFYFLKPTDDIPYYYKGALASMKRTHTTKRGYYYKAIQSTYEILKSLDILKPLDYEVHYPIIFEKKKFLKMIEKIPPMGRGYLFRSIYCNLLNLGGQYRSDIKAFNIAAVRTLKTADFMSSDNRLATDQRFQNWIDGKFPDRCKYEINMGPAYITNKSLTIGNVRYNPGDIIRGELTEKIIRENNLIKHE